MDKRILEEYIDACEVIKEAEAEIRKLESKKSITANETVSGSNPEFPYNPQHFKVQGTTYSYSDDVRIRQKKEILRQKKEKAEQLKLQVEVWLISIPFRMQRIIKYKIFETSKTFRSHTISPRYDKFHVLVSGGAQIRTSRNIAQW